MSKFLSVVILLPLAILLVVFCVANRAPVPVSLDPIGTLPQFVFQVPLFVLLIGSLIGGLVLGGIGTFLSQARHRSAASRRRREVENLREELDLANQRLRRQREESENALAAVRAHPAALPAREHGTALRALPDRSAAA